VVVDTSAILAVFFEWIIIALIALSIVLSVETLKPG
jgi:hypothetical protein